MLPPLVDAIDVPRESIKGGHENTENISFLKKLDVQHKAGLLQK